MSAEPAETRGNGAVDLDPAELGLAALIDACERAVDEVGAAVPPAQLRALIILGRNGGLNLNQLARSLNSTPSATSRLTDRMEAAGLLTRDRAASSRREVVLLPTETGRRLAELVRDQRRGALSRVLAEMTPDGRAALADGLRELAAIEAERALRRGSDGAGVTVLTVHA